MQRLSNRQQESTSPGLIEIGAERTRVIIVDDLSAEVDDVIADARHPERFRRDATSVYPGVRAQPSAAYQHEVMDVIVPLVRRTYAVPEGLRERFLSFYSLVTLRPDQLSPMQRIPHTDNFGSLFFAMTHYLNPGPHGGTGFFRHVPTGFEKVTMARREAFGAARAAFMQTHGDPPAEYIRTTTAHFELYEQVDYVPNRLVAYPGNLLHSGLIDPETDIDPNPHTGRLTGNFFLIFEKADQEA